MNCEIHDPFTTAVYVLQRQLSSVLLTREMDNWSHMVPPTTRINTHPSSFKFLEYLGLHIPWIQLPHPLNSLDCIYTASKVEEQTIEPEQSANKCGMTTIGVSKLCGLYLCRGCVVFTFCNFVVDVFQGFKVTKQQSANKYGMHRGFQTLRVISLSTFYCINIMQLCG